MLYIQYRCLQGENLLYMFWACMNSNKGTYILVFGTWKNYTHFLMFGECKFYQHFTMDVKGINASYGGSLCDKTMFCPLVPFIQMLVVVDISLDVSIGLGFKLTNSLWKAMCGYLFIKKSFVSNNELLKSKNMGWLFEWNITKWKK